MNINIFFKEFKQDNNYSNRGNYFGALEIKTSLEQFKKFVLNFEQNKKIKNHLNKIEKHNKETITNFKKEYPKNDINFIKEIINNFEINLIGINNLRINKGLIEMDVPHLNICCVQNPIHRNIIEVYSVIHNKEESIHDIIFDRDIKNTFYYNGKPKTNLPFNYVSNGWYFAKKYNKKFLPRFFGEEYNTNKDIAGNYRIGIYLRPDVCPMQVKTIISYFEKEYKKAKSENKEDKLPTLIIFGKKMDFDYPFIAHTHIKKEFFENIDAYLYSSMEIEDPLPNTLFEAVINRKDIIILQCNYDSPDNGIAELKYYSKAALKALQSKVISKTFREIKMNENLLELTEDLKTLNETDFYIEAKILVSRLFKRMTIISKFMLLNKIFENIFTKYYFDENNILLINKLLNLFISDILLDDLDKQVKNVLGNKKLLNVILDSENIVSTVMINIVAEWHGNIKIQKD